MRPRRVVLEAWRNLVDARQRSALALLGIAVGIGSVVAMISIGKSAAAEAEAQFRALGTDLFVVRLMAGEDPPAPGQAAAGAERRARPRSARERAEALEALARQEATVHSVAAVAFLARQPSFRGKTVAPLALGVSETFFDVSRASLRSGRALTALDAGRRFCVLGSEVAAKLAEAGAPEPVGLAVEVGDRRYEVVGALAPAPRTRLAPYVVDDAVLVPIEIATRASEETVSFAIGRLDSSAGFREAVSRIQQRLQASDLQTQVETAEELVEQMERQSRLFTLLLGAIGAISLVGGGIGVMNMMLSSVAERKREIALLRALGARRATVQSLFVAEALLLGVLGGACGLLAGLGTARLVCHLSGWPFQFAPGAALTGVVLAVAIAVFFGSFPARQAARIHPMAALR